MTNVTFFAVLLPREKRHDKLRKNEGGGAVGKEGLIDRAVVYVCCTAACLALPALGRGVVPLLAALCLTALLDYFDRPAVTLTLSAAFLAGGIALPGLAVFLPLVVYDALKTPRAYFAYLAALPLGLLVYRCPEAAVGVCVLTALAVLLKLHTSALETSRAERNAAQDEMRRLQMELERQSRALLESQDAQVSVAKLAERSRIAREIHDSVGHLLSSSLLQVGALKAVNHDEALAPRLDALKLTLDDAMDSVRASVHDLHDDAVDLDATLRALARDFSFCPLDYSYALETDPPPKLRNALIAVAKEGLTNIARHSNATRAALALREHPAFYQFVLADNGTGGVCDPEAGIGLKNIRDRVESFRGVLTVTAKDGFRIFITIPKEAAK